MTIFCRPLFALAAVFAAGCAPQATPPVNTSSDPAPDADPKAAESAVEPTEAAMAFYDLKPLTLEGETADLSAYRGKVTLVVNVASECGYTPQYAGLQQLHTELKDRGFAVLGFPSNDFGGQEPGSADAIRAFCTSKYSVDFPMFAKVQTKAGAGQSPVYALLGEGVGQLPSWNFCKYLIGKDGEVLGFFSSRTAPDDAELRAKIEAAL